MIIVLTKAEYQQPPAEGPDALDPSCGGRDPMPEFLLEGTITEDGQTQSFSCKIANEIDGRDGEYTRLTGPDMDFASDDDQARDRWEVLISVLDEYEPWLTKFQELSASYYS